MGHTAEGTFPARGVFPPDWLKKHNLREMYALYHLLRQFCTRHPDALRRAQVLIDVDNQSVVGALDRGRALNRETHALLVQLFEIQVEYCFMWSLEWIPRAENGVADAISRPSREAIIRIAPASFKGVWAELGPFNVDLMACTASVLRSALTGGALPFSSLYDCAGPAGADVFAQDVLIVPGTRGPGLDFVSHPLSWPNTHRQTHGGMQGSRGCPLARCEGVLVPLVAVRQGESYRCGSGGGGWVLFVVQCRWWPQELALPSLEDDSVRGGLPPFGLVMAAKIQFKYLW